MNIDTRRNLGSTGLRATSLGLGGAGLAGLYQDVTFDAAIGALEAAWSAGVRYFDTAPFYGYGKSEHRVGHALRQFLRTAPRNDFLVSTKVGRILKPRSRPGAAARNPDDGWSEPLPFEPCYDYSYDGVMRSHEDSLQRLGMENIDILLVHDIGGVTHGAKQQHYWQQLTSGGGFRALDQLRSSGTIGAVGLGVNEAQVVLDCLREFDLDCCLLAGRYSLLEQHVLDDFFPECARRNVAVMLGGVFNSGILAKGVGGGGALTYNYGSAPPAVVQRVRELELICHAHAVPLAAAALQFAAAHPQVSSVICGGRNGLEVRQNADDFAHPIPPEFWRALRSSDLLHPLAPLPADPFPEPTT